MAATTATPTTLSSTEKQREFVRWKRQQDARRRAELQQKHQQTEARGNQTRMRRRQPLFFDSDGSTFADAEPSPSLPSPASAVLENTGDDTDEDELMRMIMEKERREEAKERAQAAALRRKSRPLLAPRTDDFYSPVRPADADGKAPPLDVGRAPFRVGRVVDESRADSRQRQEPRANRSDPSSNQAEEEPRRPRRDPRERVRMRDADEAWDHFVSGTSTTDSAAVSPYHNPSALGSAASQPRKNIFREEISTSRSRPMSQEDPPMSMEPATQESADSGRPQQQPQPQSTNYLNVSIPTVSYTPPMSPAASFSRRQQATSGSRQTASDSGAGDESPDDRRRRTHAAAHEQYHDLHASPAAFPLWSLVVFLAACAVIGLGGFFVDDVLDLAGRVSTRAAAISLSKTEQKQMHSRLEQLQSELLGFRHTASEIETHSLRVFDEVKTHLARMKSEREKHQEAIAREMNDLRASMLHMMSDMVAQERQLIHSRLQQLAATASAERRGVDSPARAVENATKAPAAARSGLSRGESMMLLSWELLMMLTGMSVLGGFVGIRVRNINRRKRWFDQRRERRELQAQLARERAERLGEFDEDEEDGSDDGSDATESVYDEDDGAVEDTNSERTDDDQGWSDSATESGVETVSLMRLATDSTPKSQGTRRRVRLRALSTDAEDDGDGENGDESSDEEMRRQSPQRKKAERYSFVRDDLEQSPSSRRRSPRLEERLQRRRASYEMLRIARRHSVLQRRLLSTAGPSSADASKHLFFTTRDEIAGREIVEEIGMVSAAAVRSKSVISDMYVALAGLFGGEAVSYTALMNETMEEAAHRMQFAAQSQGATAVVNVRFDSNTTMNRLVFGLHCSVICYGTAVRCRPAPIATAEAAVRALSQ
ncbi:hypothetical protein PybrP1_004494 [[Pythium] brassicae (nom. inval.)]|nr:hypothetical protein PybrP1_004494 [[Pythium] brassicae (nom. inval.)]